MIRNVLDLAPRLLAVVAITVLGVGAAQAQKVRPGLWENSVTMKSGGGQMEAAMAQMQQQMAAMSPEQRAQVEAMMARQGVGMAVGKPTTVRVCVTPEMAARNEMHTADTRCTNTGFSRTGNTVRFKFSCLIEGTQSQGEGEFTLLSDTEHRGKMAMNAMRQGQAMRMDMESTGKWLAKDCGDVKPLAAAK